MPAASGTFKRSTNRNRAPDRNRTQKRQKLFQVRVLLVAKRDRIGRLDPLPMAMIESAVRRKRARIVSAAGEGTENDDPSSILMRRMIDAFAEYR
jgi:DNA invertase Pin-like site-specific DNA recombinase